MSFCCYVAAWRSYIKMKIGTLFSGVAGFELAASWLGWETVFTCEIDQFCNEVLKKRFPDAIQYTDITKQSFYKHRHTINLICGGFPCQPFSVSGNKAGTDDARFLWKDMLRAIRQIQPEWVVAENVGGIFTNQSGLAAQTVISDLEDYGYAVQPIEIPAIAIGANHIRNRVWFVGHSDSFQRANAYAAQKHKTATEQKVSVCIKKGNRTPVGLPNTSTYGWKENWETIAVHTTLCRAGDGVSDRVDGLRRREPNMGHRFKALGNAIVPQVAYQIFLGIEKTRLLESKYAK